MATPTFAEAATQLGNGLKSFADLIADFPTIVTSIDAAEQDLEGDYLPGAIVDTLAELRRRLSNSIAPALQRQIWDAWGLEVMRIANLPYRDTTSEEFWAEIHRYMHDQSQTFNSRDLTVAATGTADGGNTGDGTLLVLAVDHEGYDLEYATSETKTWECVRDQSTRGARKGAEVFRVSGQDASKDNLDETGSGLSFGEPVLVTVQHAGTGRGGSGGGSALQNSSFDGTYSGSGAGKIAGWTIGSTPANLTRNTSTVYQLVPGTTSGASIQVAAGTDEITQALSVQRIDAIGERTPWVLQVAVKKTGSGDTGTLTLKCGSQSQAFNLANSPFNNTNWNIARLDIDTSLYYHNWKEDAPDIEIEWASTSDVIYLDAVKFAPMTFIDGLWYWLDGGETAFLLRDKFTHAVSGGAWADAELLNSARQAGIPVSLPSATSAGETISDP